MKIWSAPSWLTKETLYRSTKPNREEAQPKNGLPIQGSTILSRRKSEGRKSHTSVTAGHFILAQTGKTRSPGRVSGRCDHFHQNQGSSVPPPFADGGPTLPLLEGLVDTAFPAWGVHGLWQAKLSFMSCLNQDSSVERIQVALYQGDRLGAL